VGDSLRHLSFLYLHLFEKEQPEGMFNKLGTKPSIISNSFDFLDFKVGMDFKRPFVYGCLGE